LKEYIKMYKNKTLPITNLEFMWKNQDFAYQMRSDSNKRRLHLRGWNYWFYGDNYVYFITISDDKKYKIELYNNFLTPIHKIDKNIDLSRNYLYSSLLKKYPYLKSTSIKSNIKKVSYYDTDWFVYVVRI
jgi:hypothetical protein